MQSRFMKIFLPRYTEEQFIALHPQKKVSKLKNESASYIGRLVFSKGGDIRNVIPILEWSQESDRWPSRDRANNGYYDEDGTEEQEQLETEWFMLYHSFLWLRCLTGLLLQLQPVS